MRRSARRLPESEVAPQGEAGCPVTESIHINLIKYRSFCPIRCLKARNEPEMIIFVDIFADTSQIIVTDDFTRLHFEIINQLLIFQLYGNGIIIEIFIRLRL